MSKTEAKLGFLGSLVCFCFLVCRVGIFVHWLPDLVTYFQTYGTALVN